MEDLASAKAKTSTFDRPKEKKAKKSSRRSLSADLTQSESEFSERDEGRNHSSWIDFLDIYTRGLTLNA